MNYYIDPKCNKCEHLHYHEDKIPDEVYNMSVREYMDYIDKIPCRSCKYNNVNDNYSESLKKCPFCGSDAVLRTIEDDYGRKDYTVECSSDDCCCGIGYYKTKEEAYKKWNRRK